MFGKNKTNDIERNLYEKEIKSLKSQLIDISSQLEIANKYRNEYKELSKEYKKKIKEVDELKKETTKLNDELSRLINAYKN